jgi:hypothetical protein
MESVQPPTLARVQTSSATPSLRTPTLSQGSPSIISASTSNNRLPTTIPAKNPLALRLYKVLGANYQDASTKEALETLSAFYSPELSALPSITTSSKVKTMTNEVGGSDNGEDDEDDEEEAWGADFVRRNRKREPEQFIDASADGELALKARRDLRRDIETRLTESSRKFLAAFSEVDKV